LSLSERKFIELDIVHYLAPTVRAGQDVECYRVVEGDGLRRGYAASTSAVQSDGGPLCGLHGIDVEGLDVDTVASGGAEGIDHKVVAEATGRGFVGEKAVNTARRGDHKAAAGGELLLGR
jgi:hypothetical protein